MKLQDLFESIPDGMKHLFDALSLTALLGVLVSWLPAISSLLTIIWMGIRIVETRTVQGWLGRSPPE